MSRDLVERQEIIDRLDRVIEKGLVNILSGEHPITAEVMKEVIMALPSAQPDLQPTCNQLATDCISRQDAIDVLEKDKAKLDHIIKGLSGNDVRIDHYVAQHNQIAERKWKGCKCEGFR